MSDTRSSSRPSGVSQAALLIGAHRAGIAIISSPKLAKLAGVSTRTAWLWLRGGAVSFESEVSLRAVLGLPSAHLRPARRGPRYRAARTA